MENINNVNQKRIKKLSYKQKIARRNRFLAVLGLGFLLGRVTPDIDTTKVEAAMPEGYMLTYTTEQVDYNETLSDIAAAYYNEDLHSSYYLNFDNYVNEIAKLNNTHKNDLRPFQDLIIPTLVEENNIYLQQIASLKAELETIPTWVSYTIAGNDTITGLAYLGAGDDNEAYEIKDEIMRRNGLTSAHIQAGDPIYIVNPQIGEIKKRIRQLEEQLNESLKDSNTNSISL